jgi:hypothetical protein
VSDRRRLPVWSVVLSAILMFVGVVLLLPGIGVGLCVVLLGGPALSSKLAAMSLAVICAGVVFGGGGLALILRAARPKR